MPTILHMAAVKHHYRLVRSIKPPDSGVPTVSGRQHKSTSVCSFLWKKQANFWVYRFWPFAFGHALFLHILCVSVVIAVVVFFSLFSLWAVEFCRPTGDQCTTQLVNDSSNKSILAYKPALQEGASKRERESLTARHGHVHSLVFRSNATTATKSAITSE